MMRKTSTTAPKPQDMMSKKLRLKVEDCRRDAPQIRPHDNEVHVDTFDSEPITRADRGDPSTDRPFVLAPHFSGNRELIDARQTTPSVTEDPSVSGVA